MTLYFRFQKFQLKITHGVFDLEKTPKKFFDKNSGSYLLFLCLLALKVFVVLNRVALIISFYSSGFSCILFFKILFCSFC
ncbi:MAG: hypothetical protein CMP11_09335 [Zetaproteobacteria bacterium]|nr:hypothetical protein [Pseudobdellovibrionaceae bacterium]